MNTVSFRKHAQFTFRATQFIAYYVAEKYVVLGKRKAGETKWILNRIRFEGKEVDVHNSISMVVDSRGGQP